MGGGPPTSAGSSGHPCVDGETGPEAGERDVGGCEVKRGEDWAGGDVTKGLLSSSVQEVKQAEGVVVGLA